MISRPLTGEEFFTSLTEILYSVIVQTLEDDEIPEKSRKRLRLAVQFIDEQLKANGLDMEGSPEAIIASILERTLEPPGETH